ncbi:MAG: hypothetical protein ACI8UO_005627 [Verrucomicrobiales bacterium]|jgi:hypothetical protein
MNANTRKQSLVSIAMLKVNFDHSNKDYIDYLGAFVVDALHGESGPITAQSIHEAISAQFGLRFPNPTLELYLKRLVKRRVLKKGLFRDFRGNYLTERDLTLRRKT